ncbi:MAG: hypothetical protein GPOALKHO_000255 [Sodalis sp.]|uniref:hypothetical protein n=1 Tax=Sodalis sp. (in: enterobacteria) TaxID=1898979 RepID=UPI0038734F4B|nr:MAG: hypothetical protein GPOALKHO_000255 [Sodalis sp.]
MCSICICLFIYRLSRTHSQHLTTDVRLLQPMTHPLIATEHEPRSVRAARSPLVILVFVTVALLVVWLLTHR